MIPYNHSKKDSRPPKRDRSAGRYCHSDIRFMNSLSAAVLAGNTGRSSILLYIISFMVVSLILWASWATIDERTRGLGRVIPSRQIQVVQNLEGGILKEIWVNEGDPVTKGQVLVVIDDTGAGSTYAENRSRINELNARVVRLGAEAGIRPFKIAPNESKEFIALLNEEKRLYESNTRRHESAIDILKQRLKQREIELSNTEMNISTLKQSTAMIAREIELMEPIYAKRLVSELEFIQLKQKALDKDHELNTAIKSINSLKSKISEVESQIREVKEQFQAEAQEEFNKVKAEIERLANKQLAIADQVARTHVRSPVDGTVKQLLINTVGGVVMPGMDIIEIVPKEENPIVETKIKPSDIAFIYPGLKAIIKLTAYDFAIYGGLDGRVQHISADTITDERQEEYYLVRIETETDYLGTGDNKKVIKVGMTAQVDIITGSKTIMQYLMKPILRARDNALRER